jgi:hypothetical protein
VGDDDGGVESGSIGGYFLGLGGSSTALSWIDSVGLVSSNGGDAACDG